MTPTRTRAQGLVTPSLPQQWLGAMLRVFVELVLNVASTFRMCFRRRPVIGTQTMPAALPEETNDKQEIQDRALARPARQTRSVNTDAVAHHDDDRAIMINRATPTESFSGLSRESRLAQHRDCRFIAPLIPMKIGIQGKQCGLFRIAASIPRIPHHRSWIPAFAGMSGVVRIH